jgi:hypothetical protein
MKKAKEKEDNDNCLIYPENKFKKFWDLFINLVLLIFCFKAPFDVVFIDNPSLIS